MSLKYFDRLLMNKLLKSFVKPLMNMPEQNVASTAKCLLTLAEEIKSSKQEIALEELIKALASSQEICEESSSSYGSETRTTITSKFEDGSELVEWFEEGIFAIPQSN